MGTQFVKIPRKFLELRDNTKFIDVLVYAALDFQKNKDTSKSRLGMRTIANKYDISLMTVEASVKRLSDLKFITIEKLPSFKYEDRTFNEYSFTLLKEPFLMLNPELLTLPISAKERGVLIFLQLIAVIGLNDIAETKIEDIANRLGITRQTASKYLKIFLNEGYITKPKHLYICKYLFNTPKTSLVL